MATRRRAVAAQPKQPPKTAAQPSKTIEQLIEEYQALDEELRALRERHDGLRQEIVARLKDAGLRGFVL